ncbi:ABC transporter substrate-binding protein [Paenalcaligenes niemegkensis]|uniref:ABC transporter substrate-binding protein n=1 Tax=Paenalcaligenes niemegkensis TaxID=2895469 RepID=UPI002151D34F|nr:ABC transporter substrate-binding protein [Paenalcaligenes niemegkensis]MCQ9616683.1 ABC transporter substrate-binding protein [Paenalcaligenes niemegkensis]
MTLRGLTLASDYAAGREYIEDFKHTFEEQGGSLGQSIWTPLGTSDFAPIIMNMAAAQPRFIYSFLAGADAVRFLQQMKDYKMHGRVPVVGPGALFDQEDVIPATGDASLGGISTFHQSPGAPAAADFVRAYQASRGRLPGEASTAGYATGQVIKAGVDAVEGDVSNKDAFKDYLLGNRVNTAFGPMHFDPRNNQAILDIYVNEVRQDAEGKPFNTVIHTYEHIQDPGPKAQA